MLGSCSQGELLRIKRHNVIRSILANELRRKAFEVHEEVQCLAEDESTRRIDIIVINRHKSEAEILDPTIRFERSSSQPREVDLEKKRIYEPTVPYFQEFYNLKKKIQLLVCSFGQGERFPNLLLFGETNIKLVKVYRTKLY